MPTPSYAVLASAVTGPDITIGAGADETGILIGDLSYTHDNPSIKLRDRFGGVINKITNYDPSLTIDVEGVVADKDGGLNVDTFIATTSMANADFFASASSTYNGIDYTGAELILEDASGTQPQSGERTVSHTYMRHLGIVIT